MMRDELEDQLAELHDDLACKETDLDLAESEPERDRLASDIDDLYCRIADCNYELQCLGD